MQKDKNMEIVPTSLKYQFLSLLSCFHYLSASITWQLCQWYFFQESDGLGWGWAHQEAMPNTCPGGNAAVLVMRCFLICLPPKLFLPLGPPHTSLRAHRNWSEAEWTQRLEQIAPSFPLLCLKHRALSSSCLPFELLCRKRWVSCQASQTCGYGKERIRRALLTQEGAVPFFCPMLSLGLRTIPLVSMSHSVFVTCSVGKGRLMLLFRAMQLLLYLFI